MATDLGQAYVQIIPSAKGISGKIAKTLDPEATSAGESAGEKTGSSFGRVLRKTLAAAGIGKIIKDAITAGGDLEQSIGGIETLFKDSADKVIGYAEGAYKTAGVSANDYMQNVTSFSASLLQSMAGDTEGAADVAHTAMVDMADNANKMGTSMQDIQNAYQGFAKQNYTMLDNLKLGYGGTKTEMERLLADAQKLTGVEYDIENLDDVFMAIHAIQQELEITGTTAIEAEETLSGSAGMMKASWKNLLAEMALGNSLGEPLANLAESVITFARNLLPMISSILQSIPKAIVEVLGSAGSKLANVASEAIMTWLDGWATAAPKLIPQLTGILMDIIDTILQNIPLIVKAGADMIVGLVKGIVAAIPVLIDAMPAVIDSIVYGLLDGIETIIQAGTELLSGIVKAIPGIIASLNAAIPEIISTIIEALQTNLPVIIEAGVALLDGLVQAIPVVMEALTTTLPLLINSIVELLMEGLPMLMEAGLEIFSALVANIPGIVEAIATALPELISGIVGALLELLPVIIETGVQLLTALVTALPEIISAIVAVMPEIITGIVGALLEQLPLLIDAGIQLLTSLVTALPEIIQAIVEVLPEIIAAISETLLDNIPAIIETGIDLLTELVTALPEIIQTISGVMPEIIEGITSALLDSIPLIIQTGIDLLIALIDALPQIISTIMAAMPKIITGIIDALIGNIDKIIQAGVDLLIALIENLPTIIVEIAKRMPEIIIGMVTALGKGVVEFAKIGRDLIKGLWQGIKDTGAWLRDKISGFFGGVVDSIKNFFGIGSPAKLFRDEIGHWIPAGLADGIEDNLKPVSNAMDKMGNLATRSFESELAFNAVGSSSMGSLDSTFGSAANRGSNGITQHITVNSPKELSPNETARQIKNASRQLAMGW